MKTYRLSPSDLSFLWAGCPRCFWLKAGQGISAPSIPMPAIFHRIHGALRTHFDGQRTEAIVPDLSPGVFRHGEMWVRSEPIVLKGLDAAVYFRGRIDMGAVFDDATFGIIDFKTAVPRAENLELYSRQMHAYALALERPEDGYPGYEVVTRIGLYCVDPHEVVALGEEFAYKASHTWMEVDRDDDAFFALLGDVVGVLNESKPPPSDPKCPNCRYVAKLEAHLAAA